MNKTIKSLILPMVITGMFVGCNYAQKASARELTSKVSYDMKRMITGKPNIVITQSPLDRANEVLNNHATFVKGDTQFEVRILEPSLDLENYALATKLNTELTECDNIIINNFANMTSLVMDVDSNGEYVFSMFKGIYGDGDVVKTGTINLETREIKVAYDITYEEFPCEDEDC